jgi:glycerol-1-phosphate dehydrogenase [NAD(P)+]
MRPASLSDVASCGAVCLQTGRYGEDGAADFPNDPFALSRIYTTPYIRLQPHASFALVLTDGTDAVVGYCLATPNSSSFFADYERAERPALALAFPIETAPKFSARERSVHALYHTPEYAVPSAAASFPAHLHIDLLPRARGAGYGRALVNLQCAQLARAGACGVFVNLAASNKSAAAFYAALDFSYLEDGPGSGDDATIFMGRQLRPLPVVGLPPIPGATNVRTYAVGVGAALAIGASVLGTHWVAITQPLPWQATRNRLGGAPPLSVHDVHSCHIHDLDALVKAVSADATVVAGIGGGMAVDAAKYVACQRGLRLCTIPTALTVDAFVTPPAGVRKGDAHDVEYVGNATPDPLIIDFDLLRTAPAALNVAGAGDLLSIHTACRDWELTHAAGADGTMLFAAPDIAEARAVLADTLRKAADIRACTDDGLRALVEGYMRVNALCLPAGHARVEEGSEHFLFYALEARLKRGFVHGHIIGLGVAIMSRLQCNDADEVIAAMRAMGLAFQPKDIGISRATLKDVLLGLRAFVASKRELWHSVINEIDITAEWVERAFDDLRLEFADTDDAPA